jgi:hypothetical protein
LATPAEVAVISKFSNLRCQTNNNALIAGKRQIPRLSNPIATTVATLPGTAPSVSLISVRLSNLLDPGCAIPTLDSHGAGPSARRKRSAEA